MESAPLKYSTIHLLENQKINIDFNKDSNELLICSVIIDPNNWSILTTRHLYSSIDSIKTKTQMSTATLVNYGMFKTEGAIVRGKVQDQSKNEIEFYVEAGESSMVMVQGVHQIIRIQPMTNEQTIKQTERWDKRKN